MTRTLEREAGALLGFDIVDGPNGSTNQVTQALADHAEQDLLHMITRDPERTPNFILFANPDYFLTSGSATPLCSPQFNAASCFSEQSGFAWNHGDFQKDITHTWLGMVGPGVRAEGQLGEIFTDHADIRPTILSLAHLEDDYVHDGRVVFEILTDDALPDSLRAHRDTLSRLLQAYKQINAPLGELGRRTLTGISTRALEADEATYTALEEKIGDLTRQRNAIASQMIAIIEGAEFNGTPLDVQRAEQLIDQAQDLLGSLE